MRDFIQSAVLQSGGINALGRRLGLNGSSILAWVRGESLPSADLVPALAALVGQKPEDVSRLLLAAQAERAARRRGPIDRPTVGGGSTGRVLPRSPALLPPLVGAPRTRPKRASDKTRRRRLAGLVIGLGLLGATTAADAAARLTDAGLDRGILSRRRKAA